MPQGIDYSGLPDKIDYSGLPDKAPDKPAEPSLFDSMMNKIGEWTGRQYSPPKSFDDVLGRLNTPIAPEIPQTQSYDMSSILTHPIESGKSLYNEAIRPLTSALGLGSLGMEAGIGGVGKYNQIKDARTAQENFVNSTLAKPTQKLLGPRTTPDFISHPSGKVGRVIDSNTPETLRALDLQKPGTDISTQDFRALNRQTSPVQPEVTYGPEARGFTQLPTKEGGTPPPATVDTGLGFSPTSNADLPYPLNIAPEAVRPRNAQSVIQNLLKDTQGSMSEEDAIAMAKAVAEKLPETAANQERNPLEPGGYSAPPKPSKFGHTPREVADVIDRSNPAMASGDIPKPPIDAINSHPIEPVVPSDNIIPRPGQSKPTSLYATNFNSPNKTLLNYEATAPISRIITQSEDEKMPWIVQTNNELLETTKGLNKPQRIELMKVVEGGETNDPAIQQRAESVRHILDSIFSDVKDSGGATMNYMNNYITHIEKQPEGVQAGIKAIFDYHGLDFDKIKKPSGDIGNFFEQGTGHPTSHFIKERQNQIRELELDPNKIFPIYVESIAKVVHDAPAVDKATKMLENIPPGPLKEMATAYIKNYSRYDAEPELHNAWNSFSNAVANTSARSVIGLNPGVHMLHVGQIAANIYPELGEKYTALGFKDTMLHPIQSFKEMTNLGLLQTQIKPFAFKTPMEKLDSVMYGLSTIESVVKGTAFNGFKRMLMDQGMSNAQATMEALNHAKDATLTVSPARMMKGFTPEANLIGGEYAARNTMQFKQIPLKFVEQYMNIAKEFKEDASKGVRAAWAAKQLAPMLNAKESGTKLARATGGAALAGIGSAVGAHTFHLNPMGLIGTNVLGVFGDTMEKVVADLRKGDVSSALMDTATWLTPGGAQIRRMLKFGG